MSPSIRLAGLSVLASAVLGTIIGTFGIALYAIFAG